MINLITQKYNVKASLQYINFNCALAIKINYMKATTYIILLNADYAVYILF